MIRVEHMLGDLSIFENESLSMQVQTLYNEMSSFTKVKMNDVRAKLNILETEALKISHENKTEKMINATKKREILKKVEAMISDVEIDENMCEKSIAALDDSSSSLELMANLITRLHGKTEMLTEATQMTQNNKQLLQELIDSMQKNLQILQNNSG